MTISSTLRKAGPYRADGNTRVFPFAFKVFKPQDVVVVQGDADGNETPLPPSVYQVELHSDQDASPGGQAVLAVAPPAGVLVALSSAVANLQPVELTNQGGFYPAVINNALDRLTILVQQCSEKADRSFKVPLTSFGEPGDSIADYIERAKEQARAAAVSATQALAHAAGAWSSEKTAQSYLTDAKGAAKAARAWALSAVSPTSTALAAYLDAFFPLQETVEFAAIYQNGGFDMGGIGKALPFSNETAGRRCSLSHGSFSVDYGALN